MPPRASYLFILFPRRNRAGFNKATRLPPQEARRRGQQRCPDVSDVGTESRLETSSDLLRHVSARYAEEKARFGAKGGPGLGLDDNGPSLVSFWWTFIRLPLPPGRTAFFAQGSVFSITAAQIRRRPLQDYKLLLEAVSRGVDPYAGYYLEYLWFYVLTSQTGPCPVSGYEFDYSSLAKRYRTPPP